MDELKLVLESVNQRELAAEDDCDGVVEAVWDCEIVLTALVPIKDQFPMGERFCVMFLLLLSHFIMSFSTCLAYWISHQKGTCMQGLIIDESALNGLREDLVILSLTLVCIPIIITQLLKQFTNHISIS